MYELTTSRILEVQPTAYWTCYHPLQRSYSESERQVLSTHTTYLYLNLRDCAYHSLHTVQTIISKACNWVLLQK